MRSSKQFLTLAILLFAASCIEDEKARPYDEFLEDYEAIQNGTFVGYGFDAGNRDFGTPSVDLGPDASVDASTGPQCSVNGDQATVTFVNNTGRDALLMWVDYECTQRDYGVFLNGATAQQVTFIGHVWQLVAGRTILAERVVARDGETISFE